MSVPVTRLPLRLTPDPHRVITRFFCPGDMNRAREIIARVLAASEPEVETQLAELERFFRAKHQNLFEIFADHYEMTRVAVPVESRLSTARQLLVGACFTMQYALESVALFNPSIVPAMSQEGVPPGAVRFVMSLRATGKGHISSIVFRTGVIHADGDIRLDAPATDSEPLKATLPFQHDLAAMGIPNEHTRRILDRLGDDFTRQQLSDAIDAVRQDQPTSGYLEEVGDSLISATRVNYKLRLPHAPPGTFREVEIVIFPFSDIERHGIKDLRLVRFTDDDGSHTYYGTFAAYNGMRVFPQLLEYRGASTIDISLITGEGAKNKGWPFSPDGFEANTRWSRSSITLYYMEYDDIRVWDRAQLLQAPKFAWQVIQIGNCGSPIETEMGKIDCLFPSRTVSSTNAHPPAFSIMRPFGLGKRCSPSDSAPSSKAKENG